MSRISFIALGFAYYCLVSTAQADNHPAGYVTLCTSHDADCTLQTTANVAFGRDSRFSYRVLTGSFVCNAATFGTSAPAQGECSIPGKLLRSPAQQRPSASNYGGRRMFESDAST
jgi:hypothetical protein